jgi:hypothetical protein
MAVTQTTRLNIYRWSAGTDALTRAQMDASHEELEDRVAGYSQAASRPAAAAAYKGFFHYSTTGQLSYCNGTAWADIAVENTTDGNIGEIDGTASAGTSASGLAYAEHKHSIAAGAITNAMIDTMAATKLTGTINMDRIGAEAIVDAKIADLDASKLSGSLSLDTSGNAATADDATNSTNVNVLADNSSSTAYLLFATGTGNTRARRDTDLSYNASSNTLTADNFVGDLTGDVTGTADVATNTAITHQTSGTLFYPTFVTSVSGNQSQRVNGNFYYNPGLNLLGLSGGKVAASEFEGDATGLTSVNKLQLTGDVTTTATSIGTGDTASMSVTVNDSSHAHGAVTKIFVQNGEPTSGESSTNDLWINTSS